MILWRISRHRDLSGIGGLRASARWHHQGQPIVYLAESPAAALLEVCIRTSANDAPPEFTLLRTEGPEIAASSVTTEDLPSDRRADSEATRERGSAWLRGAESVLPRVPSAIVPDTWNFLFNPIHPDAVYFRIAHAFSFPFDNRLKK